MYRKHFHSDRMHMYDAGTNTWSATPPPYPCIQRYVRCTNTDENDGVVMTSEGSNLSRYIDMSTTAAVAATVESAKSLSSNDGDDDYTNAVFGCNSDDDDGGGVYGTVVESVADLMRYFHDLEEDDE
mmetsp:Transcript_13160/g.20028  ORF Transcript_13160/g.20028 Transcript_13160/m.20028 type:complete len:127 (+) Transcript_13160:2-382(+)